MVSKSDTKIIVVHNFGKSLFQEAVLSFGEEPQIAIIHVGTGEVWELKYREQLV